MSAAAKPFATEAEMCGEFIAALPEGWTAYAETAGWDILLARPADGFQIGVEAKLRLNTHVIAQALDDDRWYSSGPDCRAVLVPSAAVQVGIEAICAYIGVVIIRLWPKGERMWRRGTFTPLLPSSAADVVHEQWPEWGPPKRCALPDYVPDVAAGAPAPTKLTQWKIKAIKIAILLDRRGYVTRDDFRALHIDHRRWLPSGAGWLTLGNGRYTAGQSLPNFKAQHPTVYDQIAADFDKWEPKAPLLVGAA